MRLPLHTVHVEQQVYGCLPRLDPDPATGKPVAGPVSVRTQRTDPSQQQQFTFYPLKMSKHTQQTQSAIQAQPRRLRFSRDSLQKACNMLQRLEYAENKEGLCYSLPFLNFLPKS